MKRFKCLLLLIFALVIGCDSADPTPLAQIQPTTIKTATPIPTPSLTLTATGQPSPMQTETSTKTPTPTQTPTLAATSTVVPTETPQPSTPFPSWVNDQTQPVFFAASYGSHRDAPDNAVSLFNADSGERIDFVTSRSVSPKWILEDDQVYVRFGYPTINGVKPEFHELLNVDTGEVTKIPTTNERFGYQSPDGSQIIYTEIDDGIVQITLRNLENESEKTVAGLFDNKNASYASAKWTTDSRFFAIEQLGKDGKGVGVYNFHGEPYRLYDNISMIDWSPTLPHRLLYNPDSNYQRACILDLESSDANCLEVVDEWREFYGNNTFNFSWMPTGNSVSFSYWDYSGKAGVCTISIDTEATTCPLTTKDFASLKEAYPVAYVRHYVWSPDEKYLTIFANPFVPASDDGSLMVAGVLNVESEKMIWFDSTTYFSYGDLLSDIWRPEVTGEN